MARFFKYSEHIYASPGEEHSIADVKQHLTTYFPGLRQAETRQHELGERPVSEVFPELDEDTIQGLEPAPREGDTVIEFVKRAGTKGRVASYTFQETEKAHTRRVGMSRIRRRALKRKLDWECPWDTEAVEHLIS